LKWCQGMRVQWMIGRKHEWQNLSRRVQSIYCDNRAFLAASRGEHLNPDSCKFTIVGILNSSSPSETGVESGLDTGPPSFDVESSVAPSEEELWDWASLADAGAAEADSRAWLSESDWIIGDKSSAGSSVPSNLVHVKS
jgi:hypothetical protein